MKKRSLFCQLSLTYGSGILLFSAFVFIAIHYLIVTPISQRQANDFASLIMLSAQTWLELPPGTRHDFEMELNYAHELSIGRSNTPLPATQAIIPSLDQLKAQLEWQSGKKILFSASRDNGEVWYWTDLSIANNTLRVGFKASRIKAPYTSILILVLVLAILLFGALSLWLSHRLSRPLKRLSDSTRLVGKSGERVGFQGTAIREIDQLQQDFHTLDQRIRKLLQGRDILLSGLSHDLRTPLARITLAIELLKESGEEDLKQQIRDDITSIDRLISETSVLAKALTPAPLESVDLGSFLEHLVAAYQLPPEQLTLQSTTTCSVCISPSTLRRVLTNLIDNALRHSQASWIHVDYHCDRKTGCTRIRVQDNGIGIEASLRETVFLPFYKADRARHQKGNGLGLAISRQLAEVYGWTLELDSNQGKGCCFTLTIPQIKDQDPEQSGTLE